MIGFSKPGVSHPVSPATIGALHALPPLGVKSKPPDVRVVVDSIIAGI